MGSFLSTATSSLTDFQRAFLGVAGATWILAYWSTRKPRPTHEFGMPIRLINFVCNAVYNFTGFHLINVRWSTLKPLVEKGNFDFFEDKDTEIGLKLLCKTFEAAPGNGKASPTTWGGLVPSGRFLAGELLKANLKHRADVGQWIKDHPEILKIKTKRPIIITGLFRSGTTLCMRLMSQDPKCRPIKLWEMLCSPPPARKETHDTDPRIAAKDKEFGTYDMVQPGFLKRFYASHPMNIREQDEELMLMADCAKAVFWTCMVTKENDEYWKWVHDTKNNKGAYTYLRRYFQYLQSSYPPEEDGGFMILKTPMHIYWLDEMAKAFPDARFVFVHRDPEKTVGSTLRMFNTMSTLFVNRNDPQFDGAAWNKQWIDACRTLHARNTDFFKRRVIPGKQRYDIAYTELMKDPVAMMKKVYDHFGEPVTGEHERAMRHWMASNPQGKHGRAKYTLEDFGESRDSLYNYPEIAEYRKVFQT